MSSGEISTGYSIAKARPLHLVTPECVPSDRIKKMSRPAVASSPKKGRPLKSSSGSNLNRSSFTKSAGAKRKKQRKKDDESVSIKLKTITEQ